MRIKSAAVAVVVVVCGLVVGCGGSTSSVTSSSIALTTPATAAASNANLGSSGPPASSSGSLSAAGRIAPPTSVAATSPPVTPGSTAAVVPQRIVSMSPTATEDLFAVGAGKQVVAVDSDSNYPSDVPKSNLSAYQPNVEAIAKYRPDLVVISDDINNIKAQLRKLKIPVLLEPPAKTMADTYQQIQTLGASTGHAAAADTVVAGMRSRIATLLATVEKRPKPLTYFHELDNTLYTVSSKTFIGGIYALAGLRDVADAVNAKGTDYPQLSAEYLIKSNPDLIFLADTKCCKQNAATFGARPGFGSLTAVHDKEVVPLDDDIASRWGPRIVEFLQKIVDAVKSFRSS